ncbi:MAG: acyltransferase [Alphaproteobacteria bacterium]|nr:acyltransferase [Alphaproteobacteria bacterium]MBV9860771.1 acyltransferase [Alphaproteobacteria bacterium]
MNYRADIDGLRAVAVVPVLLFHAGIGGFRGGYVGVDVFFVISGFVITGSLLNDIAKGRFSIARFYERRARRILPALLTVILLAGAAASGIFLPPYIEEYGQSATAALLFISNIYIWLDSGYFAQAAQMRPLLHTWSLGVEEQFYLVMPLAFYVVFRFLRRRWLPVFGAIAGLSLALSIVGASKAPTASFFLLPTRAWELLFGALLAFGGLEAPRAWFANLLSLAGIIAIGVAIGSFDANTPYPGANALFPCLGAVALIYAGTDPRTYVARLLSGSVPVAIGKISYSLYLVHWPLIVFARYQNYGELTAAMKVSLVVTSFGLAALSWRLIEQPFRSRDRGVSGRTAFFTGVAAAAAVAITAQTAILTRGYAGRYPDFDYTALAPAENQWRPGRCFLMSSDSVARWAGDDCLLGVGSGPALLWGDSLAAHYMPGVVAEAAKLRSSVLAYTMAACPPVFTEFRHGSQHCAEFNANVIRVIDRYRIKQVIMSAAWQAHPDISEADIAAVIASFNRRGIRVFVIGQSPLFALEPYLIYYRARSISNERTEYWRSLVAPGFNRALKDGIQDAAVIDPIAAMCDGDLCPIRENGEMLYFDPTHFSVAGSLQAVQRYFPLRRDAPVYGALQRAMAADRVRVN